MDLRELGAAGLRWSPRCSYLVRMEVHWVYRIPIECLLLSPLANNVSIHVAFDEVAQDELSAYHILKPTEYIRTHKDPRPRCQWSRPMEIAPVILCSPRNEGKARSIFIVKNEGFSRI